MSALVVLALVGGLRPQERVDLRLNPPLDAVMEFAVDLDADLLDGTPLMSIRVVSAQRVRREGANFRFTRYIASAFANGLTSNPKLAALAKEVSGMAGKSYPLLVGPDGVRLSLKRGKYDNADDGVPNLVIPLLGSWSTGETRPLSGFSLGPNGKVTLREVRSFASQRAAVFGFLSDRGEAEGKGALALSMTDGLPLLFEITAETGPIGGLPAARLHLFLRRQNVPGLDRLAAELGLNP
ncbi:hypothetical protein EON79_21095 [bacterium]|nr:MAG: hypothetical protein EON79_21095 [bacterium]